MAVALDQFLKSPEGSPTLQIQVRTSGPRAARFTNDRMCLTVFVFTLLQLRFLQAVSHST